MGAYREPPDPVERQKADKVVAGAGGFTGLWALTWMGAEALAVSAAVQGGFAVGSVMAGSGLTVLWWKTRTMRALAGKDARPDPEPEPEPA